MVVGIFCLAGVGYYLANWVVPKALVTMTKAAPATKISIKNSYLLGEKILAKADGRDNCVVNIFLLDESGKGVVGRRANLIGAEEIRVVNELSDSDGKIKYEIRSGVEGQKRLTAEIGGVAMDKTLLVTFRN